MGARWHRERPVRRQPIAVSASTWMSFFPQPVDNPGDNRVDNQWTVVDERRGAVDEQWTRRPQHLRTLGGRAVHDDYRGPHTQGNSMDVMGTAVDDTPLGPHHLHMHDVVLTCNDGTCPQSPHPL